MAHVYSSLFTHIYDEMFAIRYSGHKCKMYEYMDTMYEYTIHDKKYVKSHDVTAGIYRQHIGRIEA